VVARLRIPQRVGPLTTPRLELRLVRPADASELQRMFHDPVVNRYLPPARRIESGVQYVARARRNARSSEAFRFVARARSSRALVASVSLFELQREDRSAELGYALPRAYWGQGYATEAVTALLEWGFSALGLHRVGAWVVEPNRASVAVLRRLGFRAEGRSREAAARPRGYDDLLHFGLLESEFRRPVPRASRNAGKRRPVPAQT
jgi:[ribosomal protein S5]-alanine N-acetyltransferase